jgi:ATP-dependent helicase/nuclease subunit A
MWDIRLVAAEPAERRERQTPEPPSERAGALPEDVAALSEKLDHTYPYERAASLPSKLTATELKGRFTDYEAAEEAGTPEYLKSAARPYGRPGFVTARTGLTAAERGTALHLAMQYVDYEKCADAAGVRGELKRLTELGFLTAQQCASVEPGRIAAFFASPLGRSVLSAEQLRREFKFSLLVRAGDYFEGGGDDEILFQGVVDCCYLEDGKLNIIDFKTDRVTPETLGEKTGLYAGQIRAYGRAMERVTGKPVSRLVLYFFATGAAVEVDV